MIHRRQQEDGFWVACEPTAEGHEPDSRLHHYDRTTGFAISAEELAMCNRNPRVAAAERASRQCSKQLSHAQTVNRWALLERYLLEFHPDEPYSRYLSRLELESEDSVSDRMRFEPPPALLLLEYANYLRRQDQASARPDRKGSTIRKYVVTAVASVLNEFSYTGKDPSKDNRITARLKEFDDGEDSAPAFDMEEQMPKLWTALWALRGWNEMKRITAWAMLLVALSIMARASCITTYCPHLEDVKLPKARHWDTDGIPKYIIIVMKRWKSRKRESLDKPYEMKIHRNYLDPTYCPVTALLIYLKYSGVTSGPLFQRKVKGAWLPINDVIWCGMTNHWFTAAKMRGPDAKEQFTNHSIRRTAAQWAGRCGAREMDVRNAGRWRSMAILAKYMAQGAVQREEYEDDEDGPREDPIFTMWVFKKVTSAAQGGVDIM